MFTHAVKYSAAEWTFPSIGAIVRHFVVLLKTIDTRSTRRNLVLEHSDSLKAILVLLDNAVFYILPVLTGSTELLLIKHVSTLRTIRIGCQFRRIRYPQSDRAYKNASNLNMGTKTHKTNLLTKLA